MERCEHDVQDRRPDQAGAERPQGPQQTQAKPEDEQRGPIPFGIEETHGGKSNALAPILPGGKIDRTIARYRTILSSLQDVPHPYILIR